MKLNTKDFCFLTFFLIITSCYKPKSDLQGLWEFHSYLSQDGQKNIWTVLITSIIGQ